ncbi:MAG: BrnT family toxin [Bryobacteraceae bacterium]
MDGALGFEWDDGNVRHIRAHDVTPEEVEQVMADEPLDINFAVADGEERWTVVGHSDQLRFLVVVYSLRGDSVRAVTAFPASEKLVEHFAQQKGW